MDIIEETAKRVSDAIKSSGQDASTIADASLIPRETFRRRIAGQPPGFTVAELHRVALTLKTSTRELYPEDAV